MKIISRLACALAVTFFTGFALAEVKVLSYQSPGTFSIVGTPGHELSKDLATEMNEIGGPGEKTFNGDGTALTIQKISGDGNVTLNRFKNIVIIQKAGKGELRVNDCQSVSVAKLEGSGAVYLACSSAQFIDNKSGEGDIYFRGQRPPIPSMSGTGHVIALK
jgi:hypothetical protein